MVHLPAEQVSEELIQYSEQGIFMDYIYRSDLAKYMEQRIKDGERLKQIGTPVHIAIYLGMFLGKHTKESLMPYLDSRIGSLKQRLYKLRG